MKGHFGQLTSAIEPIRGKGSSESSKDNFRTSIAHFTTYLMMKGEAEEVDDWSAEDLGPEKIRTELFEEFADFLCKFIPAGKSDEFKMKTAEKYLTGAKEYFKKKYRHLEIWQNEDWYTTIRQSLKHKITKRTIDSGDAIVDSAYPLGRVMLTRINKYLLRLGKSFLMGTPINYMGISINLMGTPI